MGLTRLERTGMKLGRYGFDNGDISASSRARRSMLGMRSAVDGSESKPSRATWEPLAIMPETREEASSA